MRDQDEPSSEEAVSAAPAEKPTEDRTESPAESPTEVAAEAPAQAPSPAETAEDEDRRRAYRLNKVLGATLTSLSGDTQAARLFVIDISASGFRATDHQPHSEEQYDISVMLNKGEEPFQSRMRVVWTKELTVSGMFQMGCEFVDPPEAELSKLAAFIEKERRKIEPAKPTVDLGRPWTMIR